MDIKTKIAKEVATKLSIEASLITKPYQVYAQLEGANWGMRRITKEESECFDKLINVLIDLPKGEYAKHIDILTEHMYCSALTLLNKGSLAIAFKNNSFCETEIFALFDETNLECARIIIDNLNQP